MRKRKVFAVFLFLLGLGIILYPPFSRMYYDNRVREEVEELFEDIEDQAEDIYQQQLEYNQNTVSTPAEIEMANVGYVEDEEEISATEYPETEYIDEAEYLEGGHEGNRAYAGNFKTGVLGSLHIPKIDLVYPIYDGATDENLLKGVARIEGTSYPVGGLNTNSVISGHSSMARRNYFTRITELVNGDIVQIRNAKEVLTYEVYATATIEPTETAALAVIPGQDTVTLLTCTWPPPGTHRYLVYAKRVADLPLESVVSNK